MAERATLIDSHAHLDHWQTRGEAEAMLSRAGEAGVAAVVDIGTDEATSRLAVELAGRHPMVFATVGGHPHDAAAFAESTWAEWRRLAAHPRVVAIGECGLDYFRDLSPRDVQRRVFARHLALARELALPVVIHCRDAYGDCLDIVSAELGAPARGVMHCFLGDAAAARRALDLGLHLGLGGSLTFPREQALRQVVAGLPLDRLVVETDSPYLTPRPLRGRNEPAHVRHVAERLAAILEKPLESVAAATTANARALFALPV